MTTNQTPPSNPNDPIISYKFTRAERIHWEARVKKGDLTEDEKKRLMVGGFPYKTWENLIQSALDLKILVDSGVATKAQVDASTEHIDRVQLLLKDFSDPRHAYYDKDGLGLIPPIMFKILARDDTRGISGSNN